MSPSLRTWKALEKCFSESINDAARRLRMCNGRIENWPAGADRSKRSTLGHHGEGSGRPKKIMAVKILTAIEA
jgi:hypothetical protein